MRPNTLLIAAMLAALLAAGPVAAHDGRAHDAPAGGPADNYVFALPAPGSYRLPPIKAAAGGAVLDEHGRAHDLADLVSGRLTVLAFIYTRCADICPTATLRLAQLHDLAAPDPRIAPRLRLITMSFDPVHDTPEMMRLHAEQWRGSTDRAPQWLFLTTADAASLEPVLAAYDQPVRPAATAGQLNHVLRVFLIDATGKIRNIYSLDFLDPNLVLNDVRTLLLEDGGGS